MYLHVYVMHLLYKYWILWCKLMILSLKYGNMYYMEPPRLAGQVVPSKQYALKGEEMFHA